MSRRVVIGSILLAMFFGGWYFWHLASTPSGGTEKVGFIRTVSTNGNYGILFDDAVWLSGKEGEDAAIAAGLCTEATRRDCLPNDFIIKNDTETTELLEFGTGIAITMQTLGMEQDGVQDRVISKQEFEQLINDPQTQWRQLPYRIMIRNGLVTEVHEIYIP